MKKKVSQKYKEIFKLKKMLENAKIPFDFIDRSIPKETATPIWLKDFELYQICYPSVDNKTRWISVVEGFGTYGSEKDKLEIMGGLTPMESYSDEGSVRGWLTAKNVFKRIKNNYEEREKLK